MGTNQGTMTDSSSAWSSTPDRKKNDGHKKQHNTPKCQTNEISTSTTPTTLGNSKEVTSNPKEANAKQNHISDMNNPAENILPTEQLNSDSRTTEVNPQTPTAAFATKSTIESPSVATAKATTDVTDTASVLRKGVTNQVNTSVPVVAEDNTKKTTAIDHDSTQQDNSTEIDTDSGNKETIGASKEKTIEDIVGNKWETAWRCRTIKFYEIDKYSHNVKRQRDLLREQDERDMYDSLCKLCDNDKWERFSRIANDALTKMGKNTGELTKQYTAEATLVAFVHPEWKRAWWLCTLKLHGKEPIAQYFEKDEEHEMYYGLKDLNIWETVEQVTYHEVKKQIINRNPYGLREIYRQQIKPDDFCDLKAVENRSLGKSYPQILFTTKKKDDDSIRKAIIRSAQLNRPEKFGFNVFEFFLSWHNELDKGMKKQDYVCYWKNYGDSLLKLDDQARPTAIRWSAQATKHFSNGNDNVCFVNPDLDTRNETFSPGVGKQSLLYMKNTNNTFVSWLMIGDITYRRRHFKTTAIAMRSFFPGVIIGRLVGDTVGTNANTLNGHLSPNIRNDPTVFFCRNNETYWERKLKPSVNNRRSVYHGLHRCTDVIDLMKKTHLTTEDAFNKFVTDWANCEQTEDGWIVCRKRITFNTPLICLYQTPGAPPDLYEQQQGIENFDFKNLALTEPHVKKETRDLWLLTENEPKARNETKIKKPEQSNKPTKKRKLSKK